MNGELQSQQLLTPTPPLVHLCDFNLRLLETDAFIQRTDIHGKAEKYPFRSWREKALKQPGTLHSCCTEREVEKKVTQPAQSLVSCLGASLHHPLGASGKALTTTGVIS